MIHPSAKIDPSVTIKCDHIEIGAGAIIRKGAEIYGRRVVIGRQAFIDEYSVIGGGSAHEASAELVAGDFLTVGMFAQLNIGCGLYLGDEVGIGIATRVFTHGAWLSEYDGYPCEFASTHIGSRVWLPYALVMAGATIGDDVVVAAGAVVRGELPSGCFAAGQPATVKKPNAYPRVLRDQERTGILANICREAGCGMVLGCDLITVGGTLFNCYARRIVGEVTDRSERMRDQLRRHGIRFRYEPTPEGYKPW
jgi:acetyltransferase-like isoleucine patch superfamily enzyme